MKKRFFYIIIILLLSIKPSFILSQQNTNTQTNKEYLSSYSNPEKGGESPGYLWMVIKMLLVLVIFCGGIYYIFKYISKKQGLSFPHLNILKIITSIPVGTNRFIQLIEVGSKYYLIGSTDSSINLLSEIIDKETLDLIKILKNKQDKQDKQSAPPTFIGFLENLLGGIFKKRISRDRLNFLKIQKDRLKKLEI